MSPLTQLSRSAEDSASILDGACPGGPRGIVTPADNLRTARRSSLRAHGLDLSSGTASPFALRAARPRPVRRLPSRVRGSRLIQARWQASILDRARPRPSRRTASPFERMASTFAPPALAHAGVEPARDRDVCPPPRMARRSSLRWRTASTFERARPGRTEALASKSPRKQRAIFYRGAAVMLRARSSLPWTRSRAGHITILENA